MPLSQRLPKRGFTNIFKKKWAVLNVSRLNCFEDGAVVTPELLVLEGLLKSTKDGVKILGNGDLEKKLTVKAHSFSSAAVTRIENAGGKAEVLIC